jgi:hypothetical protein
MLHARSPETPVFLAGPRGLENYEEIFANILLLGITTKLW